MDRGDELRLADKDFVRLAPETVERLALRGARLNRRGRSVCRSGARRKKPPHSTWFAGATIFDCRESRTGRGRTTRAGL